MDVLKRTVGDLIDENYIYARAFEFLGITFYQHESMTIGEVCANKNIDRSKFIRTLYRAEPTIRVSLNELNKYPLSLIIAYLRFSHQHYIRELLPFVGRLIQSLPAYDAQNRDMIDVFPYFMQDFILHIHEEEDQLFSYVSLMQSIIKNKVKNPAAALWKYRDVSLAKLRNHHVDEDEMTNLRELIHEMKADSRLKTVIKKELLAFDRELLFHAEIENQLFFPQAINLEKEVFAHLKTLSLSN